MGRIEEWIASENVIRFRKQIAAAANEHDRAALERLLAREEQKLRQTRKDLGATGGLDLDQRGIVRPDGRSRKRRRSMENLNDRFVAELDKRRILSIATLRPDGWPQTTIVGYVNDGPAIYFMISRQSQKFANLAADNRASLCVGEDVTDPMAIGGASMAATVAEVTDRAEQARVMALMFKRYPEYEPMLKDADTSGMVIMRATPIVASVLTYEEGFGHTDTVWLAAPATRS